MIYVIANLRIKPGTLETFAAIAIPLIAESRREPECRRYDMFASMTDPEHVVFIEQWTSPAALDQHRQTPHFKTFKSASTGIVIAVTGDLIHPDRVVAL